MAARATIYDFFFLAFLPCLPFPCFVARQLWHPVSNGGFIECQVEHVRAKCVPTLPPLADELAGRFMIDKMNSKMNRCMA